MVKAKEGAPVSKIIFDTDILIWYLRGHVKAREFISGVPFANRVVLAVSYLELLQGCLNKQELRLVKDFIRENFELLPLTRVQIFDKACSLMEMYSLSHSLQTIDALVAAAALVHKHELASANVKHYRFIAGLKFRQFKPN